MERSRTHKFLIEDGTIHSMSSIALVGAVGGAGTTRTCLEIGTMLARGSQSVVILDAAYATQGLSDHVSGPITTDITRLVLDDASLAAGLVDFDLSPEYGRLSCCPAHAPFERLARAKAPDAAQRFGELIREGIGSFDHVLIDTPPVAANQAIAAVTGVEMVAVVTPMSQRGTDGLARTRDRLADIGVSETLTIRTDADDAPDADAVLPAPDVTDPERTPTTIHSDDPYTAAVAKAVQTVFDREIDIERSDGLLARLSSR
jgi:septum site-determining protein MinD